MLEYKGFEAWRSSIHRERISISSFCGQGGLLLQQAVPQGGQLLLICKNAPYLLMSVFNEDIVILYTDSSRMSTDSTLCPLTFALCPVW